MKHLLFLLLPLGAMGQVKITRHPFPSEDSIHRFIERHITQRDTVKCWAIVADQSKHLVLTKAWVIRRYPQKIATPNRIPEIQYLSYLHSNKRDSLAVIGDFKPIIQEWK